MNEESIVCCLARTEIYDEDDGIIAHSLYLYKRLVNGGVEYVVIKDGTRYEFINLIAALSMFNELNYRSLI